MLAMGIKEKQPQRLCFQTVLDWYSRRIASKAKAILDSNYLAFAGAVLRNLCAKHMCTGDMTVSKLYSIFPFELS